MKNRQLFLIHSLDTLMINLPTHFKRLTNLILMSSWNLLTGHLNILSRCLILYVFTLFILIAKLNSPV